MSRKAEVAQLHPKQVSQRLAEAQRIAVVEYSAEDALEIWDRIEPYIELSARYNAGRSDIETVKAAVNAEDSIVVLVFDRDSRQVLSVIVGEGYVFPNRTVFSVNICGGHDVEQWGRTAWHRLQAIAKRLGFDQIEVIGRRGWEGFLDGAHELSTTYVKDLEEG
jgi:hypothetical protein